MHPAPKTLPYDIVLQIYAGAQQWFRLGTAPDTLGESVWRRGAYKSTTHRHTHEAGTRPSTAARGVNSREAPAVAIIGARARCRVQRIRIRVRGSSALPVQSRVGTSARQGGQVHVEGAEATGARAVIPAAA